MIFLKILKNKYLLVIIGLIVWLLYFDRNDVFTQFDLISKCNKLNTEKEYYISEIEKNKKEIVELQTNKKSLETFAREKYHMKLDNEDVFVFVQK
ncbi:MAG: septum formation initiator family protein [Bacteroidota bacterium]